MHGCGDNQPNVQKSKIQSYSAQHCTINFKCTFKYFPKIERPRALSSRAGVSLFTAVKKVTPIAPSTGCGIRPVPNKNQKIRPRLGTRSNVASDYVISKELSGVSRKENPPPSYGLLDNRASVAGPETSRRNSWGSASERDTVKERK